MSSAESARVVAQGLADWCGAREVDGANIGKFYRENDSLYKATVQAAKAPGLTKGLRSFIALHRNLLICRIEGTVLFISKSEALDPDPIAEISAKLKRLGCGNDVPLAAIENLLAPLKDDTSMRQFGSLMKTTGLCLRNGKVLRLWQPAPAATEAQGTARQQGRGQAVSAREEMPRHVPLTGRVFAEPRSDVFTLQLRLHTHPTHDIS